MKPSRRLGKGLADMVGLHGGTIVTSADHDDGSDQHDAAAKDDSAPGSVLHLLSTEVAGLPGPRVVKRSAEGLAEADTVAEPTPTPTPVPQPEVAPPPAIAEQPTPVVPVEVDIDIDIDIEVPVRVEAPQVDVAPAPVVADPEPPSPEPEPEVVSEGFTDDWFDPPLETYSPVSGFRRVEPVAAAPEPVAPPPASAEAVVRPPEPAPPPAPEPEPQPEPEPVAVLDDPLIVDDGLFFDDVVVGSFLPEVDLDG